MKKYFILRISQFTKKIFLLHYYLPNLLIIFFLLGLVLSRLDPQFAIIFLAILIITPIRIYSLLAIIALGVGYFFAQQYNFNIENDIKYLSESNVELTATVVEPPGENIYSYTTILRSSNYNSLFIANLPKNSNLAYADKIQIRGRVIEISDSNQGYKNYLNSKGIFLEIKNPKFEVLDKNNSILKFFSAFRDHLVNGVNRHLFEPEASLFNGIVLGKKDNLSGELKESLKLTGTSHIISASGFNVITIYVLLSSLSGFINRKRANLVTIFALIFYLLTIGIYNLPALRATIMLIYILVGKNLGRKVSAFTALLFSIFVISIISPLAIYNISMQLSIFATVGLFSFSGSLNSFFSRKIPNSTFNEILSSTIAASIFTLPIIWLNFEEVSLIAIAVNVLVLPLIPIVTYLGLFIIPTLYLNIHIVSEILFWPIHKMLELILNVINLTAKLSIPANRTIFFIYLGLLILLILIIDYLNYKYEKK